MKDINLNSLKIFLAVATSTSFLEASNKLYISQPAISKSINKLEEELGTSLFYRANKGVTLTSDGEILLKYVKDSQNLLQACERMLSTNNNIENGSIIIGAQSHLVRNYLLDKVSLFRKTHPNVTFKILDLSTLGLLEALEKHIVDFVIDSSPIVSTYNNIKILPIFSLDTCFIKSKNNKNNIKTIYDISKEIIILPVERSSLRKILIKTLEEKSKLINPSIEFETEELIIESVKKNMGVGYVVNGKSMEIEKDSIDVIKLNKKLPSIEINLVYIESSLTKLSRLFIDDQITKM